MTTLSQLKMTRHQYKWTIEHIPTRLTYTHETKSIAIFELGKLVERQQVLPFSASSCVCYNCGELHGGYGCK